MTLQSARFKNNQRLQRAASNRPPMREGETGEAVRILQRALIDLGFLMPISTKRFGSPDGIYGDETTRRVREFQAKHGLSQDGVAGHDTLAKLDALLPHPAVPPTPPLPAVHFDRKVRLHFRSVAMPKVPELTMLAKAQEIYAPHNIQFEFASGLSMGAGSEKLLQLDASDGTCNWNQASDEQKMLDALGGRQGAGPNDVVVYYVNQIQEKGGGKLNGCAGHLPGKAAVVVATSGILTTLAHEVGHVLLGPSFTPVHATDPKNLMHGDPSARAKDPIHTPEQIKAIRASSFCVPT